MTWSAHNLRMAVFSDQLPSLMATSVRPIAFSYGLSTGVGSAPESDGALGGAYGLGARRRAAFRERLSSPSSRRSYSCASIPDKGGSHEVHDADPPGKGPDARTPEAWERLSDDEQNAVFSDYQAINETPGVSPGL